jgi:hypothetical protein
LLSDLIGNNYFRVNSVAENINWSLDDYTNINLKNIRNLGHSWWNTYGEMTIKFLSV